MAKVKIPFLPEFEEPMLNRTKTQTARTKIMGMPGDTFDAFGAEFQILTVSTEIPLWDVAEHWKNEGCLSWNHFISVWEKIHPRKGFDPDQNVVVHTFRKLGEA